jgi:hypothetical protein
MKVSRMNIRVAYKNTVQLQMIVDMIALRRRCAKKKNTDDQETRRSTISYYWNNDRRVLSDIVRITNISIRAQTINYNIANIKEQVI